MVITTAKLHLLREKVTVETLRRSENYTDVSQPVEAVCFNIELTPEHQSYTKNLLLQNRSKLVESGYFTPGTIESEIDYISDFPGRVLIVNLDHLEKYLIRWLNRLYYHFQYIIIYYSR